MCRCNDLGVYPKCESMVTDTSTAMKLVFLGKSYDEKEKEKENDYGNLLFTSLSFMDVERNTCRMTLSIVTDFFKKLKIK